nr:uncharacterized protein LOC113812633 [Penaeus vannamei]
METSSANANASTEEMEVSTRNSSCRTQPHEFSLKRSRDLSVEGELGDPLEKRAKVFLQETGTVDQEKEIISSPAVMTQVTRDMPLETATEGTMAESKVKSGISPTEDKSDQAVEKDLVISEAKITNEKSTDLNPDEESESISRNCSSRTRIDEFSLNSVRIEGDSGGPVEVSLQETGTAGKGEEMNTTSPATMAPATQGMQTETASEGTMTEANIKSGISSTEDKSEDQETEKVVIPETRTNSEKSATTEESEKASQTLSSQPSEQQTTFSENKKPLTMVFRSLYSTPVSSQSPEKNCSDRNNKCSICGKNNCPLDPKRTSKMSSTSVSSRSLARKKKSPVKAKLSKVNAKKMKKEKKERERKGINTRSETSELVKRIANHSSLHIFKLKAELFRAVENGDLARMQELIQDTGAAVRRSKTRCTLLHAAASHNQADVVMFLLKLISPNITNKEGQTPAHVAAEKGHTQVLKLLVRDPDFDADKRDNRQNSVKSLLGSHLFKAVLEGNKREAERLLAVGADPDSHGGKLVDGLLARELGVTTPRLLANALNMKSIAAMFAKKTRNNKETVLTSSPTSAVLSASEPKVSTRQFNVRQATTIQGGADVYKMDKEARGFVRILNFSCFKDRSDLNLQQLDYDARIMSDVFDKMGYMCETHSSLTAQQTKEVLNIRNADVLTDVGCAIFVISGYGVNGGKILTSDMQCVDTDYILNLFKDSECPQLKNKPKLFIFNLFKTSEAITSSRSESPKVVRLADPLKDMACIYSNSIGLDCVPNGKGTSFSWSLCRALADHSAEQELGDLYREFLKEYSRSSPSSSPELRYFGFTKKFFFNPL